MLQCIPALRHFHEVEDDNYKESIIATAVILRHLEEIDHDSNTLHATTPGLEQLATLGTGRHISFLAIIDAILRSPWSQSALGNKSLVRAAYSTALRQEIHHSFTQHQAPEILLPLELWQRASNENKTVIHLVQVAKWRWGDKSELEWGNATKFTNKGALS